MLRNVRNTRSLKENLMLASSTAFVSGIVNVAGLLAFFAFSSNVTGHVANLAKNIADVNTRDVISLCIWLLAFFSGAFLASYLIQSLQKQSAYKAHATPFIIEAIILLMVAVYADTWFNGDLRAGETVVTFLLFSMGLQNGTVSKISGGLIKTSHVTGLITDLGSETADYWHPETEKSNPMREKLYVRITILLCYIFGGLMGALIFYEYHFKIFYLVPAVLMTILFYDLIPVLLHRISKVVKQPW